MSSSDSGQIEEGLDLLVEVSEVLLSQQIAFLVQWQADSETTMAIPKASQPDFSALVERLRAYKQRLAEYRARLPSESSG